MNGLPALLANGLEDVIGFVVFLVIAIVIWAVQAFGKMAQKGRPQPPKRPAPKQPAQGGGLEDEIGDFLRKAARRGQPQREAAPPARQHRGERAMQAEVVGGQQRPVPGEVLREQALQAARQRAKAEQLARRTMQQGPQRAAVARQTQGSGTPRDMSTPALASSPAPAADAPRVKLASIFAATQPDSPRGVAPAAGLYAMLSEPANLRQAIVLAEILGRPEDRW